MNNRFVKKIVGDELYLYYKGVLIYKRWVKQNRSVVFDVATYDKNTLVSITENEIIKRK